MQALDYRIEKGKWGGGYSILDAAAMSAAEGALTIAALQVYALSVAQEAAEEQAAGEAAHDSSAATTQAMARRWALLAGLGPLFAMAPPIRGAFTHYTQFAPWPSDSVPRLFFDWLNGVGPLQRTFGGESPLTAQMMDSVGMDYARTAYLALNSGGCCAPLVNFPYSFEFGLLGPFDAGFNLTQQFVGSYTVSIYPNGDGMTADVFIQNPTSVNSALYHVPALLGFQNPTSGMGATQTQVFHWTEFLHP